MKLEVLGVDDWTLEEHGPSTFSREYAQTQTCYVVVGAAHVTCQDGDSAVVREGDLVTLLAGMVCTWHVCAPIKLRLQVA